MKRFWVRWTPSKPPRPQEAALSTLAQAKSGPPVWMIVATVGGTAEGSIITGRLHSLGVPAFLQRESIGSVLALTIGLGRVNVVVPEAYFEIARTILEPDESTPWLSDGEPESDDDASDQD